MQMAKFSDMVIYFFIALISFYKIAKMGEGNVGN